MTAPKQAEEAKSERRLEKEAVLDAPIEEVWKALTDPTELTRWFPLEARVTPGPGGIACKKSSRTGKNGAHFPGVSGSRRRLHQAREQKGRAGMPVSREEHGPSNGHFKIGCQDKQKTADFCAQLFDWKVSDGGSAAMVAAEPNGITGHITSLGHTPHHYTIFYVEVDDVPAYSKKAAALRGKTLVPPVEIPTGMFAWMQDPDGNTVGSWKPQ